jgi:hypothetical protein
MAPHRALSKEQREISRYLHQNAQNRPLDRCLKLMAAIVARPPVTNFINGNQIGGYWR